MSRSISRRAFLAGAGTVALGAGAIAAGCDGDAGEVGRAGFPPLAFVPFHGEHQAGITTHPAPAIGLMASFTALARDRGRLIEMFDDLTDDSRG